MDAPTPLEQSRERFADALAATLAECGFRLPDVQEAMRREARRAFDELATLHSKEDYQRLRSLTASHISLVHPDDMDLTVSLINLNHLLSDACERELPRLHLLFMRLLGQQSSVLDQLPVGPQAVCSALRGLCDSGEIAADLRLELPSLVEAYLIDHLRLFYVELTRFLQQEGVQPAVLPRYTQDGKERARRLGWETVTDVEGNLGAYGEQESAPVPHDAESPAQRRTPLGRLRGALLQRRGHGHASAAAIDPALINAIMERVFQWITERQQKAASLAPEDPGAAVSLDELHALLPPVSSATLDAVGMSFDTLLADPMLCAAIRPALERLRLPVSKATLLDASVLERPDHPVRRLLDVLLELAFSLSPALPTDHPVCAEIASVARNIQQDFERDPNVFSIARTELEILVQSRNDTAEQRCIRLVPLAEREARREQSRSRAARAIRALCAAEPPLPVRVFLEHIWVRVLATIHRRHGEKSSEWFGTINTANRLIDSVQPKSDHEARERLSSELPSLLEELRTGLESIGTPQTLRDKAFQSFVACHAAALRSKRYESTQEDFSLPNAARIETLPDVPGLCVVRLSPESEPEKLVPEWIAGLQPGDWLQITLPDHAPERVRVCWQGGSPRVILAAAAETEFMVLCPQRWLIQLAAEDKAQMIVLKGLFERAAEAAIQKTAGA